MTTKATWIIHQTTTLRQIRGVVAALDEAEALDYTQLRIMTIEDGRGISLPNGQLITADDLPAQGILLLPDDIAEG